MPNNYENTAQNQQEPQNQQKPQGKRSYLTRREAVGVAGATVLSVLFGAWNSPSAYAKKKKKTKYYKIVYKLNGGKNPSSQVLRIKYKKKLSVKKLKKPTRTGYTFMGWFTNKALTKKAKTLKGKKSTATRRVYAKWELKTYKIKYHLNGGSNPLPVVTTYNMKSDPVTLRRPTREGYYFVGWYSDETLKTATSGVKTGSTGTKHIYAKWKAATWWDTPVNAKCTKANGLSAKAGATSDQFIFLTDFHMPSNTLYSPYLAKWVASGTSASMVVFGGDALNYSADKNEALNILAYMKKAFSFREFHFVRGNHDANDEGNDGNTATTVTDAEFLALTQGKNEVRDAGKLYYYRDNTSKFIRYIFLDSGHPNDAVMDSTQIAWLKERVLELDEGWTAVIFVHQFFNESKYALYKETLGLDANGKALVAALDGIYDEAKATIAGVICGHCHRDYSYVSKKGWVGVSTTCDAYDRASGWDIDHPVRTPATVYEQAFDIVTLDTANDILYFTRIGAGHDRSFSYAPVVEPEPETPDEPETPSDGGEGTGGTEGGETGGSGGGSGGEAGGGEGGESEGGGSEGQ